MFIIMDNNNEISMADYMNELNSSIKKIHEGDILKGSVLSVSDNGVIVNIGYMTDGIISREELSDDPDVNPVDIVKVGDEISVYVLEVNDGEGNVSLSKKLAESMKVWEDFENSLKNDSTISVKVSEVVKGGVVAKVQGVRTFIPASQLSASYVEDLSTFVGKILEVKVIELDREKKKVVLSRKEIEKAELEIKKEKVWATLKKGEKRSGVVTRLAKFGAFVDLGGVDGLVHLNDLSWKRVTDPSQVVAVGDKVEVYVLDFDKVRQRISLGLKDIADNPWNNVFDKFKVGSVVEGTVSKLMDFGAFVKLEGGVEGLVHISEISDERILKPSDVLKAGDKVNVKILEINKNDQRMSLSIKDAQNKNEEFVEYMNKKEGSMTIADLLKDKLKGFKFEE
jgi:small subunit ribosomal protein S1